MNIGLPNLPEGSYKLILSHIMFTGKCQCCDSGHFLIKKVKPLVLDKQKSIYSKVKFPL